MRKEEFMRRLEMLLADISEEERKEALAYYRSYFEDAGEENEERILRELESPDKVAATIKADLRMDQRKENGAYAEGAYTEHGFEDGRFREERQEMEVKGRDAENRQWGQEKESSGSDDNRTLKIILIVVIAVLTSPIWGSLLGGILSFILGLISAAIGFVVAAAALYVTGGVLFGIGISQFVVGGVAVGFGLLGAAMLVWVVAILMTILSVWICRKGIPWICYAVGKLWRKVFPGKEQAI